MPLILKLFLIDLPCEAKRVKRAWMCWALGAACWLPETAHAYCRQYSCQDDPMTGLYCERDEYGCISEGNQLFYATQCLSYTVARGHAERFGLSDLDFERLVGEAFERWTSVDCGDGKPPGLMVQSAGIVDADEPFFCGQVELNTSVWLLVPDWPYDADALGYTTSTYAEDDAEVFDADVELNVDKVVMQLPPEAVEEALVSIITHEAGHYLGLAHSDDPGAVMYASYNRSDLVTRMLTQDDIDGICNIFPPEGAPAACAEPGVSEAALDDAACEAVLDSGTEPGCAVASLGQSSEPAWYHGLWVLGLTPLLRRRRRP